MSSPNGVWRSPTQAPPPKPHRDYPSKPKHGNPRNSKNQTWPPTTLGTQTWQPTHARERQPTRTQTDPGPNGRPKRCLQPQAVSRDPLPGTKPAPRRESRRSQRRLSRSTTGGPIPTRQQLSYVLPAPPAHWILALDGIASDIPHGGIDSDYPFPCSAGYLGGATPEWQRGPQCREPCPKGKFCGPATLVAQNCTAGSYCETASASPTFCAPGTYGSEPNRWSQQQCSTCPPGSRCSTGQLEVCHVGTFQDTSGQSACDACP